MSKQLTAVELDKQMETFRRVKNWWVMIGALQLAALVFPPLGASLIGLAGFVVFIIYGMQIITARQISDAVRRERQAEADARDFVRDRATSIQLRMQAMLEKEARERFKRQGSREMFRGNCIDITPEQS
jgi:hypothetical protein